MSNAALFTVGAAVTLLVVAALALLVYAAVLDGRDERRTRELRAVTPLDPTTRRPNAA
jgi:hypothetical protein